MLLIEHPYRQDFKLLTPEKAAERSRDVYRFEVKLRGGGFYTYTVLVGDRIAGLGTVYSVPQ